MSNLAEQFKHGAGQAWESLSEGWRDIRSRAGSALTQLWPSSPAATEGDRATKPAAPAADDDEFLPPPGGWAVMAADMLDYDDRIVVRIEAPGLARDDFDIRVDGSRLIVAGEKRVQNDVERGRVRLQQSAYGRFVRELHLPVPVQADRAKASCRDGVLRVELPKADGARVRRIAVNAA